MPWGTCRLCDSDCDLQLSHILPAFVFQWKRETSGTGHIRSSVAPSRRVQDGEKRYWSCSSCEARLSKWEAAFATRLFHPCVAGGRGHFRYGPWLLLFCISVSWRVLHFYRDESSRTDYPADVLVSMDNAETAWKEVLLTHKPQPGPFQQHLPPVGLIKGGAYGFPPNFNRYLRRSVDMHVCWRETTHLVYSKMGPFVLVGFMREDHPAMWRGTKVHATEGLIRPRRYDVPSQFWGCMKLRAQRMADSYVTISPRQRKKIEDAYRAIPGRLLHRIIFAPWMRACSYTERPHLDVSAGHGRRIADELSLSCSLGTALDRGCQAFSTTLPEPVIFAARLITSPSLLMSETIA